MSKFVKTSLLVALITSLLLTGCTTAAPAATATEPATQAATEIAATETMTATEAATTAATEAASSDKMVIYAPATASSIPVLIAAGKMDNVEVTLYTNQSQANTLFLRGDVNVLVSGLSVGVDLFKNEAPVQMVNSYVSGLSYLVTYGKHVNSFADLKGQEIYIPFEGSPIEEVTAFLAEKAGVTYKEDLSPVYAQFDSSVELLKEGKAQAVILPEPNVSLVEGQPNIYISISLYDAWNQATGSTDGYPQVGSFANSGWAANHADQIAAFNKALGEAITEVQDDPATAVDSVSSQFKLPAAILKKSLDRTRYHLLTGQEMADAINNYYTVIGKPLDEKYSAFYYLAAQ